MPRFINFYMKKLTLLLLILLSSSYSLAREASLEQVAAGYTQLTNIPTIYINTFNNVGVTSKDVYVYAKMVYVDGDSIAEYDSLKIRGRGNSTWSRMPKKSYRIKFNNKEKFLGKGYANAKNWTLLANCTDKAMIRNALTRDLGEFINMKNTPAARFVDLYLDGTYLGSYQISDQVEVHPHRVNITEQDEVLADTSNITGGYLLEVDGFADTSEKYFYTGTKNIYVRIHYPDEDYLQSKQTTYISNYVNSFEKALFSTDYADSVKGYRPYIDSTSLINWYIATEMTANVDGFWSTYFYKDQNDAHLYFGPLWDYDIAYNNCSRTGDVTDTLMMDQGFGTDLTKVWMNQMWKDSWFANKVNQRWKEIVAGGLDDFLNTKTDSLASAISRSEVENYKKWSISYRYYNELVLHSTYQEYITDLHNFINGHITFLTRKFASRATNYTPSATVEFKPLTNYYYRIFNKGASTATIDITNAATASGSTVCLYSSTVDRQSQQWQFVKYGDYYQIINRLSGMALNDPTNTSTQAGTSVQLTIVTPNYNDNRQLWTAVAQGTDGYYNLKNIYTGKIINNAGHSTINGNMIVSYPSDVTKDASSDARLWAPEPDDEIIKTSIESQQNVDYALTYNKDLQMIHFISESPSDLSFIASVYSSNGTKVGTFKATEEFSTSSLQHGIYIVTWYYAGRSHSAKFSL